MSNRSPPILTRSNLHFSLIPIKILTKQSLRIDVHSNQIQSHVQLTAPTCVRQMVHSSPSAYGQKELAVHLSNILALQERLRKATTIYTHTLHIYMHLLMIQPGDEFCVSLHQRTSVLYVRRVCVCVSGSVETGSQTDQKCDSV